VNDKRTKRTGIARKVPYGMTPAEWGRLESQLSEIRQRLSQLAPGVEFAVFMREDMFKAMGLTEGIVIDGVFMPVVIDDSIPSFRLEPVEGAVTWKSEIWMRSLEKREEW
jgi:hypothetical protein